MSKAADSLQRRFGSNLSESLGVRSPQSASGPPLPRPGDAHFPRETGPDDGRTRARDAGHMELSRIVPDPDQPRKEFDDDAIERLAGSLLKHGQLMPIRVRWNPTLAKWVVISGERRYRAAVQAGLKTVACIFAEDGLTTSEILQEQIIENLLREDLKPVEQARAYRQLMEMHNWTAKELSAELQVSQGAVSKSLSLLSLPDDLQAQVETGAIPATTAYEVARVADPDAQRAVARRIIDERLTRDAATEVVREVAAKPVQVRESRPRTPRPDPSTSATRSYQTSRARVVITFDSGPVSELDLLEALQEATVKVMISESKPGEIPAEFRGESEQ